MTARRRGEVRRPRPIVRPPRATIGPALILVFLLAASAQPSVAQERDTTRVGGAVADSMSALPADSSHLGRAPLPDEVIAHLGHLAVSFNDTPGGMGLIATAMAEAEIAADLVRRAGRDATDLATMRRTMADVLHAIDPAEVGSGAGLGYGFKRATEEVLRHVALAEATPGATSSVRFHAPHIRRAARGALRQADQAIDLARRIQRATEAGSAHRLVQELAERVRAMTHGEDGDGDGRIGYVEEESGLAQATYHLTLIRRAEGLAPMPDPR